MSKGPFVGPLLSYKFNYLYTKIPVSVFKIKKEIKIGDKIFCYRVHFVVLLDYKSKVFFKETNQNRIKNDD
jgi:hypothetical protein